MKWLALPLLALVILPVEAGPFRRGATCANGSCSAQTVISLPPAFVAPEPIAAPKKVLESSNQVPVAVGAILHAEPAAAVVSAGLVHRLRDRLANRPRLFPIFRR
jgi:hypothetical protein